MVELSNNQEISLIRFLHDRSSDILSDVNDLGQLEPLLTVLGEGSFLGCPKDFWEARGKLKEVKALAEQELRDYVPWHLMGDFSYQVLRIYPKLDTPIHGLVHYRLIAQKTDSGFKAGVAAYLEGHFVPGTLDALGVESYAWENAKDIPIAYFMKTEDVNNLEPRKVINAIRVYSIAISALKTTPVKVTITK